MRLDNIMFVEEVAEALHVRRQTIFAWISRGKFPRGRRRPGLRRSFWTKAEIENWLLDGSAAPARGRGGRPRKAQQV